MTGSWPALRVADAARREWAEAHAPLEAAAKAASRELRAAAWTSGSRSRTPRWPRPRRSRARRPPIDPETWAALKARADRAGRRRAAGPGRGGGAADPGDRCGDRQVWRQRGAEPEAVTEPEAEAARAAGGQDRAAALEEIRAEVDALSAKVDQLPDPAAERRAEMAQAGIDEPVVHEPQAEPSLEASWQPGDAQGHYEPQAERTPSLRWRSASADAVRALIVALLHDRVRCVTSVQRPGGRHVHTVALRCKSTTKAFLAFRWSAPMRGCCQASTSWPAAAGAPCP